MKRIAMAERQIKNFGIVFLWWASIEQFCNFPCNLKDDTKRKQDYDIRRTKWTQIVDPFYTKWNGMCLTDEDNDMFKRSLEAVLKGTSTI